MTVVECSQHLEDVEANVKVGERLVESTEVYITSVYILHDQSRGLSHWVSHDINQVDNVHTSLQGLQDLDLTSDLSLLH